MSDKTSSYPKANAAELSASFPIPTPADVAEGLVKGGAWVKAPPPGRHSKAVHELFAGLPGYIAAKPADKLPKGADPAVWHPSELEELVPQYK